MIIKLLLAYLCMFTWLSQFFMLFRCAEPLAIPQMRWLGIHPSDFQHLDESLMKELSDVRLWTTGISQIMFSSWLSLRVLQFSKQTIFSLLCEMIVQINNASKTKLNFTPVFSHYILVIEGLWSRYTCRIVTVWFYVVLCIMVNKSNRIF